MKLALIRHGETDWNLEKRIQGRTDRPLCAAGMNRLDSATLPAPLLQYRWYCSPLQRAVESARRLGLSDYILDNALIEMSWGEWEGEILKPLRKRLGDAMRVNEARGLDFCPPGGESPRQVQRRLQTWLMGVASTRQHSAAVVHKGVIRCIYALAFDWDMRGEAPLSFDWDAIHLFELAEEGRLQRSYQTLALSRV